ncbi:hypothetical protein K9N08_01485 [Candidatus Gracilibacteria bacterium]|nr:hypothetical protein [Candidatus Gracilibacteria bacterium]MCF7856213.1 hypothetical protein [Candidatus Gracilibacteria bacterium]MCF7896485.1 hypothetical protein [Candidatus Gracilibacteria bacterium]
MAVPALFFTMFPTQVSLWIFGAWFALGFFRFIHEVMDWYFDALLVTNFGVIDLDWRSIFDKSSQRIDFDTLTGVSFEKRGILSNIFNFGNFTIQSFGGDNLNLPIAVSPQHAEREVMEAKEKYTHERGMEDEKVLKEVLAGMVQRQVRGEKERGKSLADLI